MPFGVLFTKNDLNTPGSQNNTSLGTLIITVKDVPTKPCEALVKCLGPDVTRLIKYQPADLINFLIIYKVERPTSTCCSPSYYTSL